MTIIACVDLRMGLSFNGKRQTRDKLVVKHMLNNCDPKLGLTVTPRSGRYIMDSMKSLDEELTIPLHIVPELTPKNAQSSDVFIETGTPDSISELLDMADHVILYVWNTTYLYTEQFPDIQNQSVWTLTHAELMEGSSHDEITIQLYERNE